MYSCTLRALASYLKMVSPKSHIVHIAARRSADMLHVGNMGFVHGNPDAILSVMFVPAGKHAAFWRRLG